jgi:hypothetical protein
LSQGASEANVAKSTCLSQSRVVCCNVDLFTATQGCSRKDDLVCGDATLFFRGARLFTAIPVCLPRCEVVRRKLSLFTAMQACLRQCKLICGDARFVCRKTSLSAAKRACLLQCKVTLQQTNLRGLGWFVLPPPLAHPLAAHGASAAPVFEGFSAFSRVLSQQPEESVCRGTETLDSTCLRARTTASRRRCSSNSRGGNSVRYSAT